MKRILLLSILLVLLAAAINIAVALGFWMYSTKHKFDYNNANIGHQEIEIWRDQRQSDWPLDPQGCSMQKLFGITQRLLSWHNDELSGSPGDVNFKIIEMDHYFIFNTEFGWPLRCIADERWTEAHKTKTNIKMSEPFIIFGAPAPNHILWKGMFVNVLYYCFSISLAFLCWSYSRRGVRRMRNRCIKCGYDLRGTDHDMCPECGWGREGEG